MCAVAALLAGLALGAYTPGYWRDLERVELDGTGRMLFASFVAVLVTAMWWLRRPMIARGRGFSTTSVDTRGSTTHDASHTHTHYAAR
jgi:ABC-type nickel/cobalt efflux system permease component RcnA